MSDEEAPETALALDSLLAVSALCGAIVGALQGLLWFGLAPGTVLGHAATGVILCVAYTATARLVSGNASRTFQIFLLLTPWPYQGDRGLGVGIGLLLSCSAGVLVGLIVGSLKGGRFRTSAEPKSQDPELA